MEIPSPAACLGLDITVDASSLLSGEKYQNLTSHEADAFIPICRHTQPGTRYQAPLLCSTWYPVPDHLSYFYLISLFPCKSTPPFAQYA